MQIWPDQFFRQHFHLFPYRFWSFAVCCRIAQNEPFCDGLIETFPQDSEDTLHNAWAERRFFQRNVAVVVISAVLAHLVDRALNLNGAQLFQRAVTQRGKEMVFHTLAVQRVREVVDALPEGDAALLRALYLQTPPLTLRAYSEKTGIPVMTLHYRKEKLLRLLKQQI